METGTRSEISTAVENALDTLPARLTDAELSAVLLTVADAYAPNHEETAKVLLTSGLVACATAGMTKEQCTALLKDLVARTRFHAAKKVSH